MAERIEPVIDPITGGLIFEDQNKNAQESKNAVDPYKVKVVDYDKLIDDFGCERITKDHIKKIEQLTKQPAHIWLQREIFFTHRDLDHILAQYEKGNKFYLYTGRGPSKDKMHLGHLLPFMFTKYLQDAFQVPLVIQLTDDEKFFHKGEGTIEEYQKMGIENAKDIIACGFDLDKTFIFLDSEYIGDMYMNVCKFQKMITYNQLRGIFGVTQSDVIGKMSYPAIQAAPAISSSFKHIFGDKHVPCLVPQGIDQDPYFRMTRDVQGRLKVPKTACIHNKFFPALQGFGSKMSTSDPNSAIFLTDTEKQISQKIKSHAFSGGQDTQENQEKFGANLEVDIPYQWLRFFMQDEKELNQLAEDYKNGKVMTSVVKNKLIEIIYKIIKDHQERRAKITDEDVRKFMAKRPLKF